MPNSLYNKARQRALAGGMNLLAGDVRALLIDTEFYTFSAAHEFRSEIPLAAIVATSAPLTDKSIDDGVFDAGDVQFIGLVGPSVEALILFRNTGSAATDELVIYIDEGTFPVGLSGGSQTFQWSDGPNKIFRI